MVSFHADVLSDIICLCLWSDFVFLSEDQREDYLALFDSSSDGRKKLASLSKTSPDRTTWNILVFTPFIEELFIAARCRFLFCKSFILTSLSSFPTDVFIKNYIVQYCYNSTTGRQGFSSEAFKHFSSGNV